MEGLGYEDFENNKLIQDAIIREMEILGEAAKRVSDEIKENYPQIPWRMLRV